MECSTLSRIGLVSSVKREKEAITEIAIPFALVVGHASKLSDIRGAHKRFVEPRWSKLDEANIDLLEHSHVDLLVAFCNFKSIS